jgi:mannose-6-phosphate isomerase-like protein (cupin superfamily)
MSNFEIENSSRRNFLRTVPVAAAAGFALTESSLFASHAEGQIAAGNPQGAAPAAFQLFSAQTLEEDIKALQAKPGNKNLVESKTLPFAVVLTTETAKSAKEFEWHESRDHIFQIIEGTTVYELGGTPKNGRKIRPGEWLAPEAEGATSVTVKKGDMLVIPRGTLHRRSTAGSVTFSLISPSGSVTA